MPSVRVQTLRKRLFPSTANDWRRYHGVIRERLHKNMKVVEVGAGRGTIAPFPWNDYQDVELVGLDPDPTAAANPFLQRFELLKANVPWPVDDGFADLVIARYVLEHVEHPTDFLSNVTRVLKPGGQFIFLTPNRRHPSMLASRLMPLQLHRHFLKQAHSLDPSDVFPTFYRMNTPGSLKRLARKHGLEVERLIVREFWPTTYLDFSVPTFFLALAYYLAVSRTGLDRQFGLSMIGVLRKPIS